MQHSVNNVFLSFRNIKIEKVLNQVAKALVV